MRACLLALLLPLSVLAKDPPSGWRGIRFGMSEAQVQKRILELRTKGDRDWEATRATALPLPDLIAKTLAQTDLDPKRFRHFMIGHLDEGAATVRAFFVDGKLFALQAMGVVDFETYVKKAQEAYGSAPERATFTLSDVTSTGKPADSRKVEVAYWKGGKTSALIFAPSGWGPELFVWSHAGLEAVKKSLARTPSAAEESTRF